MHPEAKELAGLLGGDMAHCPLSLRTEPALLTPWLCSSSLKKCERINGALSPLLCGALLGNPRQRTRPRPLTVSEGTLRFLTRWRKEDIFTNINNKYYTQGKAIFSNKPLEIKEKHEKNGRFVGDFFFFLLPPFPPCSAPFLRFFEFPRGIKNDLQMQSRRSGSKTPPPQRLVHTPHVPPPRRPWNPPYPQ